MDKQLDRQAELRLWQQGAIFLLACALIVSRRPAAVFHAQLYAEDGHVWFADAYNLGWGPALLRTWTGYLLNLPRLGAALALLVPLYRVPLLLNLIAICFQALPANLLLASRSATWGSLRFRGILAGIYLALPNCTEVSYGITDANFLLTLSAILVILGRTSQNSACQLFDILILYLCGLSGPFSIFLLPIAASLAWKDCTLWRRIHASILVACCVVQSWALLFLAPAARSHQPLSASAELFARILGSQVYLGALLGGNTLALQTGRDISILLISVAIIGTAIAVICLLKSPMPLKMFLLFSAVLFASSLIAAVEWGRPDMPVWSVLTGSAGHRFWFFPTLPFAWSLHVLWNRPRLETSRFSREPLRRSRPAI